MTPKEFLYLLWYSFRSFFEDLIELIRGLKNPKVWSYFLIATFLMGVYTENIKLIWISLPLIFIVKIVRDKIEGTYRAELLQKDLKADKDTDRTRDAYKAYKKKCTFTNTLTVPYDDWKENQRKQ